MTSERVPVIVSAARIPTGRFLGSLSSLSVTDLGAIVVREAVKRSGIDPSRLDSVIMGNVVSAGTGQAPARQAAIRGGVPDSVPALTINKICGSGLMAAMLAAQAIKAGDGQAFVSGGMESMTNAPYLLKQARSGYRLGHGQLMDANILDGLWCSFEDQHMGILAELVGERYDLSRRDLDEYSLMSHRKAVAAIKEGRFKEEGAGSRQPVASLPAPPPPAKNDYATGELRRFTSGNFKKEVVEASRTYPVIFQFYSDT